MNDEDAKADENIRASVRLGNGCAWVLGIWLLLMALACLGWFGGQVYQAWTGGN